MPASSPAWSSMRTRTRYERTLPLTFAAGAMNVTFPLKLAFGRESTPAGQTAVPSLTAGG